MGEEKHEQQRALGEGLFLIAAIALMVLAMAIIETYHQGWSAGFKAANDLQEKFWRGRAPAGTSK